MVSRHRKLFPINGTECFDSCGDPYAEFYYLSPPPPPAPSSPLPLPLPPPDQYDGEQSNGVSPPVIVLFSLLSCFCLLILYYVVVSKSCLGFCKRRRNYEDGLITSSSSSRSDGGGDLENRAAAAAAAAVDHPIWLITTVGLQQAIINSITVVRYRKSEGLIEGTDCTVCLSEFREDETVRLLPKCSHAFHVACIDAWLRSHTNCPLCRANIVTTTTTTTSSADVNRSASRGSLDNSAGQNDTIMNGLVEGEEARVENSAEIESNDMNRGFEENDIVRLVRRSVSMDHIKACGLRRSYGFDQDFGGQKREDKFLKMIRLSPVAMKKRSLSCGGIRFFSSRQNDNYQLRLNDSIFPS